MNENPEINVAKLLKEYQDLADFHENSIGIITEIFSYIQDRLKLALNEIIKMQGVCTSSRDMKELENRFGLVVRVDKAFNNVRPEITDTMMGTSDSLTRCIKMIHKGELKALEILQSELDPTSLVVEEFRDKIFKQLRIFIDQYQKRIDIFPKKTENLAKPA